MITLEDRMRPPYGIVAAWCQNRSSPATRLSFWLIKRAYVTVGAFGALRGMPDDLVFFSGDARGTKDVRLIASMEKTMPEKTLTVDEALAYAQELRKKWCLLGTDARTGHQTYCCSNCLLFRFTRVTAAAPPDKCPRCGTKQEMP